MVGWAQAGALLSCLVLNSVARDLTDLVHTHTHSEDIIGYIQENNLSEPPSILISSQNSKYLKSQIPKRKIKMERPVNKISWAYKQPKVNEDYR